MCSLPVEQSTQTVKVAINACHGGFGLSQAAYEKLIEYGVPVVKYVEPERDPETGLYPREDNGEVIYDDRLADPDDEYAEMRSAMTQLRRCPYWDSWTDRNRSHPLVVRVIEELGEAASGSVAKLKIIEVPADVEWQIEEYDGWEHVAEKHRTWG